MDLDRTSPSAPPTDTLTTRCRHSKSAAAASETVKRTCVFYCSSDKAPGRRSIDRQIDYCRIYAQRSGFLLPKDQHVFADRGESGVRFDERAVFGAVLEAARSRRFGKLLVEALHRLAAHAERLVALHAELSSLGIEIHVTGETGEGRALTSEAEVRLQLLIEDGRKIPRREMMVIALRKAIKSGRYIGNIPFGYRRADVPSGLEIDETTAPIVLSIFEMYDRGLSHVAIALELQRQGRPSPNDGPWQARMVLRFGRFPSGLLRFPSYGGVFVVGRSDDWVRTGQILNVPARLRSRPVIDMPAWRIVDQDLWHRVQLRIKSEDAAYVSGRTRRSADGRILPLSS